MYIDILIVIESVNQSQKPYQIVDKNCISMLEVCEFGRYVDSTITHSTDKIPCHVDERHRSHPRMPKMWNVKTLIQWHVSPTKQRDHMQSSRLTQGFFFFLKKGKFIKKKPPIDRWTLLMNKAKRNPIIYWSCDKFLSSHAPDSKNTPGRQPLNNLKKGGAKNTLETDCIRFRRPESPDPLSLLASDRLDYKPSQDSLGGLDCCVVFIRLVGLTVQCTAVLQTQYITTNSALYRSCIEYNNATHR